MSKRTRKRQLQKLAQRRAEERRRRRRRRIAAGVVGGAIALGGLAMGALALFGGEEPPREPVAGPTPTPTQEGTMTEPTVACGGEVPQAADQTKPTFDQAPEMQLTEGADYRAVIETSCGRIQLDLFEEQAPITVNNFVFLAREGFYDGTIFHRVIEGFMNQGGDPEGTGMGGPGYQFEDEIVDELTFDRPGLLAMANAGPGTNGSQFFITVGPAEHLNGAHTIFGEVTGGLDVVQEINRLATDPTDRPVDTVYIESVKIREG